MGRFFCGFYYCCSATRPLAAARITAEIQVKGGIWATVSHSKNVFVREGWFQIGNRLQETYPNQCLRKHPEAKDTNTLKLKTTDKILKLLVKTRGERLADIYT